MAACEPGPGCRRWVCELGAQALTSVPCSPLCLPQILALASAALSDDGAALTLRLVAAAAPLAAAPAAAVFDAATAELLGGGSRAAVTCAAPADGGGGGGGRDGSGARQCRVALAPGARVVAGSRLVLRQGGALRGAVDAGAAFAGSVEVSACAACLPPSPHVSGPAVLSTAAPCQPPSGAPPGSAAAPAAAWDASASTDAAGVAGRWSNVLWSLAYDEGANTTARAVLQAAVDRTNGRQDVRSRLVLSLTAEEVQALPPWADYTLQVTLTSLLGTAASANASFAVVGSPPPPRLRVEGPPRRAFRRGAGLRLSALVDGGGCRGLPLVWNWTSPSGWPGLPASGLSGQVLCLPGPLPPTPPGGSEVRVSARYGPDGPEAQAQVTVVSVSSAPLARLDGPSGDLPAPAPTAGTGAGTDVGTEVLLLDASGSTDPDAPPDMQPGLMYDWECRREDHPAPCFASADRGSMSAGGTWAVPASLLAADVWHTFTVTVSRIAAPTGAASPEAPAPASAASLMLRPRSGAPGFPRARLSRACPARGGCGAAHASVADLQVLLQLLPPHDADPAAVTVAWSSPDWPSSTAATAAAGIAGSNGLPAGARLVTIPAAALPQDRQSLVLFANLSVPTDNDGILSGIASLIVPLSPAPYCTLAPPTVNGTAEDAAAACLEVEMLGGGAFPTATAAIRTFGWADGGADVSTIGATTLAIWGPSMTVTRALRYKYGARTPEADAQSDGATADSWDDGLQLYGDSTHGTLVGLPAGAVQLYGCAVGTHGASACGAVSLTVAAAPPGFDSAAALDSINATALVEANDAASLRAAAFQAAQLAASLEPSGAAPVLDSPPPSPPPSPSSASPAGDDGAAAAAAAAAALVTARAGAMVSAIVASGALSDPTMASQAVAAVATLAAAAAAAADLPADTLAEVLAAARAATDALLYHDPDGPTAVASGAAATTDFLTHVCRLLSVALPDVGGSGDGTAAAGRRRQLAEPDVAATAVARLRVALQVAEAAGAALGREATPGGAPLVAGADGTYLAAAALPLPPAALPGTVATWVVLAAGPTAAAAPPTAPLTAAADGDAEARLIVTGGAAAVDASGYTLSLQYISATAASLLAAVNGSSGYGAAIDAAASDVAALMATSGLVSVSWAASDGRAVGSADAPAHPLDGSGSYLQLRISAGSACPTAAARPAICFRFDPSTGAATPLPAAAVPLSGGACGAVTCHVAAAGTYLVAWPPQRAAASGEAGSVAGSIDADGGGDGGGPSTAVIVSASVGGVIGAAVLAAAVAAVVVSRRRRRPRSASVSGAEAGERASGETTPSAAPSRGRTAASGGGALGQLEKSWRQLSATGPKGLRVDSRVHSMTAPASPRSPRAEASIGFGAAAGGAAAAATAGPTPSEDAAAASTGAAAAAASAAAAAGSRTASGGGLEEGWRQLSASTPKRLRVDGRVHSVSASPLPPRPDPRDLGLPGSGSGGGGDSDGGGAGGAGPDQGSAGASPTWARRGWGSGTASGAATPGSGAATPTGAKTP